MRRVQVLCLTALVGLLLCPVQAAEVACDTAYCFSSGDFAPGEEPLRGVCITGLPDPGTGTVMLGSRVLREGDILSAAQLEKMTFLPLRTERDQTARMSYLPIYDSRVEQTATLEIAVWGKEDLPPAAQDSVLETYKNLPNQGKLQVQDPEGQALTYSLQRKPRRGTVELQSDGSFVYTPKKNKVGVDSFTFTAADPAGNVSREATVTVTILKPADARQYTDTLGRDCRFAAEWLRCSGLFQGEQLGGHDCFFPDKTVSRGEFLAMAVKLLEIPTENGDFPGIPADTPQWLRPYVGAALRSGLTAGVPEVGALSQAVTCEEAAVILQNALDLTISPETLETAVSDSRQLPQWAAAALYAMDQYQIPLEAGELVTRDRAARTLYRVRLLSAFAPGAAVFR